MHKLTELTNLMNARLTKAFPTSRMIMDSKSMVRVVTVTKPKEVNMADIETPLHAPRTTEDMESLLKDYPVYELKNVKNFTGMDGIGLNATLYRDGKRVGFVLDEGCGGETTIQWYDHDADRVKVAHPVDLPDYFSVMRTGDDCYAIDAMPVADNEDGVACSYTIDDDIPTSHLEWRTCKAISEQIQKDDLEIAELREYPVTDEMRIGYWNCTPEEAKWEEWILSLAPYVSPYSKEDMNHCTDTIIAELENIYHIKAEFRKDMRKKILFLKKGKRGMFQFNYKPATPILEAIKAKPTCKNHVFLVDMEPEHALKTYMEILG